METAKDMMQNLEEIFVKKSRQARREVTTISINHKMKPGQSVKDHMIEVIGHLNEI